MFRSELEAIINDGEFERLIGEFEGSWFECKGAPYQLEHRTQKAQLAKQISSFANLDGGIILFGVVTGKGDETNPGDRVQEIRAIPGSEFDAARYLAILDEWIYPKISGINARWIPTDPSSEIGVGVIEIPKQEDQAKPFIYTCVNEEEKIHEVLFGYSERLRDTSPRMKREELQLALKHGLNLAGQLGEMRAMIAGLSNLAPPPKTFDEMNGQIDEKITNTLIGANALDRRELVLSGFIRSPELTSRTFGNPEGIILSIEELTGGLRSDGWRVLHSAEIEVRTPTMLRTKRVVVRHLEVWADGTVIGATDIDYLSFLGGGQLGASPRIVPIALFEYAYQFVRFFLEYQLSLNIEGEQVFLRFDLRNMNKDEVKTQLPTGNGMLNTLSEDMESLKNSSSKVIQVTGVDPAQITVELLTEIYGEFGLGSELVPFTTLDRGTGKRTIEARFINQVDID